MSALLTAYLPEAAAQDFLLEDDSVRIGRGEACTLRLAHASVSREHAILAFDTVSQAWRLQDLGSKNGSFLRGQRVRDAGWHGPAWLRFGEVLCEFRPLDAAAVAQHRARQSQRHATWQAVTERVERQAAQPSLLPSTLAAVLELSGCERGFLLLAESDGWRVRERLGLAGEELADPGFAGSLGAVERARRQRQPVVLNDVEQDAELAARASIVRGNVRALLCLPLLQGEELLGVIYADSRRPGARISALDFELLCAFVERASLWLAAYRGRSQLQALAGELPEWSSLLAQQPAAHAAR